MWLAFAVVLIIACIGTAWKVRHRVVEWVTVSKRHGHPCGQLPSLAEVDQVVMAHRGTVDQIIRQIGSTRQRNLTPRWDFSARYVADGDPNKGVSVVFEWGLAAGCSDHAEVRFFYPAQTDRKIIEATVGPTFFGVPYNLTNW